MRLEIRILDGSLVFVPRSGRRGRPGTAQASEPARPPLRYDRRVRDEEFVQRVRRHRPSSLVPIVARYGAAYFEREAFLRKSGSLYAPWVLAEIARVSLLYGTELNRQRATEDDLLSCCAAYQSLSDPMLERGADGALGDFFLRIAGEQLSFQQSVLYDLARTAALLELTAPRKAPKIATEGWAEELLGCKLRDYVGTASLLHAGALKNAGRFDLNLLTLPAFDEVVREIPRDVLRAVIEKHFMASRAELAEVHQRSRLRAGAPRREYRRFSFNPLTSRPAISGLSDVLLIPVPGLIVRKASPLGIYYEGIAQWGSQFAEDLGELFEVYVGRQLGLLTNGTVLPEIRYGRKGASLSVDWFVVFDECILLVEVKSTRPTESIRLGDDRAGEDLHRVLGHAIEQLNTSVAMIGRAEPGFEKLLSDRPLVGLVVTMEPFHTVNAPFISRHLPACDIPFAVCSSLDLEQLVTVSDVSVGQLLHQHITDPTKRGWTVQSALAGHTRGRNEIIDQGWGSYPWSNTD